MADVKHETVIVPKNDEDEVDGDLEAVVVEQNSGGKDENIASCKRDFHTGRRLLVEGLPANATEEDIRTMLDSLPVTEVELNQRTRTATVSVTKPEECLESWSGPPRTMGMRDGCLEVRVSVSPSERLLCVAHLPLIYTEDDFRNLVQMFGPVTRCFLMRSQRTGNSKGYGFVEYASKEVATQARNLLQGKAIGNCTLHCDWLDPSHVTYASLHSKCLYVDHLPPNFRDVDELRHLFSVVVKPIYCQVVLKNGESTGVGLVEFVTWESAEETQTRLHGHQMDKYKLRVTFCVPGVHAAIVFNQLTNGSPANGKKALLPDPTINPALCSQLQMLATHNPQFFQSLQAAATNQLQNLQNNNQVHKGPAHDKNQKAASGLLGSPPSLSNNPNIQAAMVLLLATQMQMRLQQQPNLMGNPQLLTHLQNMAKMNNTCPNPAALANAAAAAAGGNLQTLLSQLTNSQAASGPPSATPAPGNLPHHNGPPPSNPGLPGPRIPSMPNGNFQGVLPQGSGGRYTKTPLLPRPNGFGRGLLPTPPSNASSTPPPWSSPPFSNGHPKPWNADFRNDGRPPNLPPPKVPLLGDRPRMYDVPPPSGGRLPLLGDRPGVSVATIASSCSSSLSPTSSISSLTSDAADSSPLLGPPPALPMGLTSHVAMTSPPPSFNSHNGSSPSHHHNGSPRHSNLVPGYPPPNFRPSGIASQGGEDVNFPCNGNSHTDSNNTGVSYPPMDATQLNQLNQLNLQLERLGNHPLIHLLLQAANGKQKQQEQPTTPNNGHRIPNFQPTPAKPSLLGCPPPPTHPVPSPPSLLGSPAHPKGSLLGDFPWPNNNNNHNNNIGAPQFSFQNQQMTPSPPQGQKRKIHSLLPLPESSPENSYIGQHSQGLGGHYADTYNNKRPRM